MYRLCWKLLPVLEKANNLDSEMENYNDIYLTAIGLTPGGNSTVLIYTQAVYRIQRKEHT
jgi:hypothetical protein